MIAVLAEHKPREKKVYVDDVNFAPRLKTRDVFWGGSNTDFLEAYIDVSVTLSNAARQAYMPPRKARARVRVTSLGGIRVRPANWTRIKNVDY